MYDAMGSMVCAVDLFKELVEQRGSLCELQSKADRRASRGSDTEEGRAKLSVVQLF